MQTISVYLQKRKPSYADSFRVIVERLSKQVHTYPVTIRYREEPQAEYHAFIFQSWSCEEYTLETRDIVRAYVSLAIVDWIVQVLEPEILHSFVQDDYDAEAAGELLQILPYVERILHETAAQQPATDKAMRRKAKIYRKVFEYLLENGTIILHGFVRFRLKEYWQELSEAVEAGIDDYLQEKQYQEFVELLRYFISHQETKYELVHIVPTETKQFLLYDAAGKQIQMEQLDAVFSVSEQKCREEDYLVSALVTIAPKKIIFHLAEEKQALAHTIHTIFDNRLSFCSACAYCLTNRRPLDVNKPTHL
jgi:putative sporulation protein YtxC